MQRYSVCHTRTARRPESRSGRQSVQLSDTDQLVDWHFFLCELKIAQERKNSTSALLKMKQNKTKATSSKQLKMESSGRSVNNTFYRFYSEPLFL